MCALLLALLFAADPDLPGLGPDGSVLLPNGWSLHPHGDRIDLPSDLPLRMAWDPSGRYLAVQHVGWLDHKVTAVEAETGQVVAELKVPKSWSGMAFSPDGEMLHVSGGFDDRLYSYDFASAVAGSPTEPGVTEIGDPAVLDLPAGIAADSRGRLFVCLQRSHGLLRVDPDGTQTRFELPAESYPFECVLSADERQALVSLWNGREVVAVDAEGGAVVGSYATGSHPSSMALSPDGRRLFVSNANENTVTVVDLVEGRVSETLSSALHPDSPPGSTPNALAVTPDGATLFIANADNNNLAVIDVSVPDRARPKGFIPVGWYPTAVAVTPDGERVIVANGKGHSSSANPAGPQPTDSPDRPDRLAQYIGGLYRGTLSVFATPDEDELGGLSRLAYEVSPLLADSTSRHAEREPDCPVPASHTESGPMKYVVYIIKENRTYDQVFGDLPQGNAASDLCIFGREVTPNHHAIAEDFVLLDNFYVEAEVSADGHEWSMGGYATDYTERTWPPSYGGKATARLPGGANVGVGGFSHGNHPLFIPDNGYLWDACARAGLSYRSYGEFVRNTGAIGVPVESLYPAVQGHFDPDYRTIDHEYRDAQRAEVFLEELREYDQAGDLPRFIVIRIGNDHTSGARPGAATPRAAVADNDLALGMILEGLSASRFWAEMCVFVVEDDAQNGPDHVDAHRSVCLVAGPYVKRGQVVSALYSTCSVVRTMELILGLPPLSQFDAAARPMYECFTATPDPSPYACRPAEWDLDEVNGVRAWGAEQSLAMDFTQDDVNDDLVLNEIIWRSVRGADAPMPRPVRAAFVAPRE